MDRQNMLVQMKVGFATIWALNTLVVVHIANMFPQIGHSKFPVTVVRTRLLQFLIDASQTAQSNIFNTVFQVWLSSQNEYFECGHPSSVARNVKPT